MEQKLKKMRQEIDCDHAEMAQGLIKWAVKKFRRVELWMYCLTVLSVGIIIAIVILFSKL